ncbi:hypothetical protein C8Q76DRAFT_185571 [Earliella scabrosa]|nr:hypothetical protein C8Q76DRAFT_185571 [Earliella scabrosa]
MDEIVRRPLALFVLVCSWPRASEASTDPPLLRCGHCAFSCQYSLPPLDGSPRSMGRLAPQLSALLEFWCHLPPKSCPIRPSSPDMASSVHLVNHDPLTRSMRLRKVGSIRQGSVKTPIIDTRREYKYNHMIVYYSACQ